MSARTLTGRRRRGPRRDLIADNRRDLSYLALTGHHGRIRVEQAHATAALIKAVTRYTRHDPASDHYGIGIGIDPDAAGTSELADYA